MASPPLRSDDGRAGLTSPSPVWFFAMNEAGQRAVCARHGTECLPPVAGSRVGVAIQTLDQNPLHGLRVEPVGGTSGWYLWAGGEPTTADDFYQPVCVEHVVDCCPLAVPFLALPPGWRFLTDGKYVDVWFDPAPLEGR